MRRLGRVVLAAALGGALLGMPAVASAVLTSSAAETNSFTAGSLATPAGVQTIHPNVTGSGDGDVRLTWTDTLPRAITYLVQRAPVASPTSWATVNGLGSGSSSATLCTGSVPGAVSCTYDDNAANSTSAPSYNASYVYQVVAKVGGWTKSSAGRYAGSLPPDAGSETYLAPRDLNAVSATSATAVWAVGANCTVVYYNGTTWTLQSVGPAVCPNNTSLNGVAANGGLPMIVGDSGITFLCTAGCTTATPTWSVKSTPTALTLNAVAAQSATSMWAVGPGCTILFWNGTTWTAKPPSTAVCAAGTTLFGVAANGGKPIFVGASATVFTCTGSCNGTPSYMTNATGAPAGTIFYAVHATANAWAVGTGGVIVGCYGANCDATSATWTTHSSGTTATLRGVFANGSNPVDVVGDAGTILQCTTNCNKQTGAAWVPKTSNTGNNLKAVYATAAAAVAVGELGTVVSLGGWAPIDTGVTDDLHAVSATSATTVWAVGANCAVAFYNGTVWTAQTVSATYCPPGTSLNGVDANGGAPMIVGANGVTFRCTAACTSSTPGWAAVSTASAGSPTLYAVSAQSATAMWAVGVNCSLLFYDGAWTRVTIGTANCPATTTLYGVDANGGFPVAAGDGGTLFTCTKNCQGTNTPNVTTNTPAALTGTTFYSVTMISTSAVWAVGSGGAIAACTGSCTGGGSTWIAQTSGSTADLHAVNASTSTLVDVVGDGGEILQCTTNCNKNTAAWGSQASPLTSNLTGVYVVSASKAYVVGVGGTAAGVGTGAFAPVLDTAVPVDALRTYTLTSSDWTQLSSPDGARYATHGTWPASALPTTCPSTTPGVVVRPASTVPAGTWPLNKAVATVMMRTGSVPSGGAAFQLLVSPNNGSSWTSYPLTTPTAADTSTLTSVDVTTTLGSTTALATTQLCLQGSSGTGPLLTSAVDLMHLDVN